jgi:beta-1,4-mannosyl-glycoprotein beta-1,4-N-acetylglucosaminyltransferase
MIFDCFMFFNELDLLEIRLNELADVVDVFVLTEARFTHRGKPKPLYFDENKDRFNEFRIEHLILEDCEVVDITDPWGFENYQRQCGVSHIINKWSPSKDDVMLLSDIDEIWRADAVKEYATTNGWNCAGAYMPLFYYYLNCFLTNHAWFPARWIKGDRLGQRPIRGCEVDAKFIDTGWHFSYLGDIQEKLASFAHAEFNRPPYNTIEYIEKRKSEFKSLFDDTSNFQVLDDLGYLPKYVLENMDRFGKYIAMPKTWTGLRSV